MAYSADTFVADEQPTTAKWNKLWTNDASFNDGTGIADDAITAAKISGLDKSNLTTDSNPYKFHVRRTTAANTGNAAFAKLQCATELYDTNSNYDAVTNFRYTAPVDGFYNFFARVSTNAALADIILSLYKNGAEILRGNDQRGASSVKGVSVAGDLQLTATDYVEAYVYGSATTALDVSQAYFNYFGGHLISRT